jgi:hypothetical protein
VSDAARLALEMGHTDTSMIFGHYRELVRADEAAKYWQIEPPLPLMSKIAHPSSPSRVSAPVGCTNAI